MESVEAAPHSIAHDAKNCCWFAVSFSLALFVLVPLVKLVHRAMLSFMSFFLLSETHPFFAVHVGSRIP